MKEIYFFLRKFYDRIICYVPYTEEEPIEEPNEAPLKYCASPVLTNRHVRREYMRDIRFHETN